MPKIISRKSVRALGIKRYFTGKPCLRGHIAERNAISGNCLECHRIKELSWGEDNPELRRERARRSYYSDVETTRALKRKSARAYALMHMDKVLAHKARRRAAKVMATPAWGTELTDLVMQEVTNLCRLRRRSTGFQWDVDHMIPLRAACVRGLHVWNNLQVIPAKMNTSKKNRMMFTMPCEWVRYA